MLKDKKGICKHTDEPEPAALPAILARHEAEFEQAQHELTITGPRKVRRR